MTAETELPELIDLNGDGERTHDEIVEFMKTITKEPELKEAMKESLDLNGDGQLDAKEIDTFIDALG